MCDIQSGDYEACEVWVERRVKARKHHKCVCCQGSIAPGEHYIRHFSVYDGYCTANKQCLPCFDVSEEYKAEHGMTWAPEGIRAAVDECAQEERDAGNEAMAAKWQAALDGMAERRKRRADAQIQS